MFIDYRQSGKNRYNTENAPAATSVEDYGDFYLQAPVPVHRCRVEGLWTSKTAMTAAKNNSYLHVSS